VVTAVSKTALGIVVTKGITLYDWVRQPNKPTYSLSEINNVSGTYTGLTVGKAQTADRLSAARTIWGQSFDGANNVTGALSGATTIEASSTIKGYRLQSTCATGTAPLLVSSTTKVGNLNADLLDSYHESAFRMGYGHDGVKYRHAAYGDGNLQWRKIVTYVNTSGGIWQGCAVIGNLWLELGNTSAQEVVEIPFQAIFTAYYGGQRGIPEQIRALPAGILRVGRDSYRAVRQQQLGSSGARACRQLPAFIRIHGEEHQQRGYGNRRAIQHIGEDIDGCQRPRHECHPAEQRQSVQAGENGIPVGAAFRRDRQRER